VKERDEATIAAPSLLSFVAASRRTSKRSTIGLFLLVKPLERVVLRWIRNCRLATVPNLTEKPGDRSSEVCSARTRIPETCGQHRGSAIRSITYNFIKSHFTSESLIQSIPAHYEERTTDHFFHKRRNLVNSHFARRPYDGLLQEYVRPTLSLNSKLARCLGYSHFERTPMMLHHFAPLWFDPTKRSQYSIQDA
jgi:hypothetical protein